MADTYSPNYNIPMPARGDVDWDDEYYELVGTVDTNLNSHQQNLQQLARDVYANPQAISLTADTDGTALVNVGAGNTTGYLVDDEVEIVDDDSVAVKRKILTVNQSAGILTMTSTIPADYIVSKNARIRRLTARLDADAQANLVESLQDITLHSSLVKGTVTGYDRIVSISSATAYKSDGRRIGLYAKSDAGDMSSYSGGTIDFGTGVITGGGSGFSLPNVGTNYVTAIVTLQANNVIRVAFGTPNATRSAAILPANAATDSGLGVVRVVLRGDGLGGFVTPIRMSDLEDVRPFLISSDLTTDTLSDRITALEEDMPVALNRSVAMAIIFGG